MQTQRARPFDVNAVGWLIDRMSVTTTQTCQVKTSVFGVCGDDRAAICQYCGRGFCSRHGVVFNDDQGVRQEVCSRKQCVAKREDLDRHLVYKAAVTVRNDRGACGVDRCGSELGTECVRCKGLFCQEHVRRREEAVFENQVKVPRMATLCRHCWARRPIWLKR